MVKTGLCPANLKTFYPNLGGIKDCCNLGGKSLLQADFDGKNDCTLTCLTFLFGVKYHEDIVRIAKTYGYDGDKNGTNPLTIKAIMSKAMKIAGVNGTAKSAYGKGIGYKWNNIKVLLKSGVYAILNLWDDGRNYYHNHSVTIVGFAEYEKHRFLLVFDNWSKGVSYIDFDKLSVISSINYYK